CRYLRCFPTRRSSDLGLVAAGSGLGFLVVGPGLLVTGVEQALAGIDGHCLAFEGAALEGHTLGFQPAAVLDTVVAVEAQLVVITGGGAGAHETVHFLGAVLVTA